MDGDAVRKIAELAIDAETRKTEDGKVFVRSDYQPLGVVHKETVNMTSLTAFCDFIKQNPQNIDLTEAIIVVNRDLTVSLLSAVNSLDGRRDVIAVAKKPDTAVFRFGERMGVDDFVIAMKSYFVKEDSDWEVCFNTARKVQIENDINIEDDGMGMKLTVKSGVSSASIETVSRKTDYALRPYRIFPECTQPKSLFFLRLTKGVDSALVSLHETDGGKWKNEASKIIRDYIVFELAENSDTDIKVYY